MLDALFVIDCTYAEQGQRQGHAVARSWRWDDHPEAFKLCSLQEFFQMTHLAVMMADNETHKQRYCGDHHPPVEGEDKSTVIKNKTSTSLQGLGGIGGGQQPFDRKQRTPA
jgi:hypothetical protein